MRTRPFRILHSIFSLLLLAALGLAQGPAWGQPRTYSQAELDSLLAPIALYPDPLLSQVLMAATYPVEVTAAAGWAREHPGLQGDAAVRAVEARDWDPSVKSLVAFPHLLLRMDENAEWTRDLGAAFLAQGPQVMDTIQHLRRRARAAGSLVPDARTRMIEVDQYIVIEPADPQLVYLPYYDPRIAYGSWWWPAHPPVAWDPWPGRLIPAQRSGIAAAWFWGPAIRVPLGFFFGAPDWRHRHLRVTTGHDPYYRRPQPGHGVHPGRWQHDPVRRHGTERRHSTERRHIDIQTRYAPAHAAPPVQPGQHMRRDLQVPTRRSAAPAPVFRAPAPPRAQAPRLPLSAPARELHPRRGTERRIAAPARAVPPRLHMPSPRREAVRDRRQDRAEFGGARSPRAPRRAPMRPPASADGARVRR